MILNILPYHTVYGDEVESGRTDVVTEVPSTVLQDEFGIEESVYPKNEEDPEDVKGDIQANTDEVTDENTDKNTDVHTDDKIDGEIEESKGSLDLQPAGLSGKDKTSELTDVKAAITQNGIEIGEGGALTNTDPILVTISFSAPIEGDEQTTGEPVKQGDTAVFELTDKFELLADNEIELKTKEGILVGHVHFTTNSDTGMVVAKVTFDGASEVFDGTYNSLSCEFKARFLYNGDDESGNAGEHEVQILDKTYTVIVPSEKIEYKVEKKGKADLENKSILWTVDITAMQGENKFTLAGYHFMDDLAEVGAYIDGSFVVDGNAASPEIDGSILRYTFPEETLSPKHITFKTEISDEAYYASAAQTVKNTAQLVDDTTVLKEGEGSVSFTPKWIEKSGKSNESGSGSYNPKDRTITWTIIANHYGASLENTVITDLLPEGLVWDSATWQKWDGNTWIEEASITPNEKGEYFLGDIHSKVLLTIVTKVPDEDFTATVHTYKNMASIRWDELSGKEPESGNAQVPIGYHAISKSGTADTAAQTIHWTVRVDTRGQVIPDLKVYDLLVYGNDKSGFSVSKVTGIPDGVKATDLTTRYNQKYIVGSFSGEGVSITVHPIEQDGKRVADLLEMKGFSAAQSVTFDSRVVNPDIFAGNKTSEVLNTASLFSGNTKLNTATGRVNYKNSSLSKEMLKREAAEDPRAGVNEITTDSNQGFNYADKSVVFRLSINGDGIDLSNLPDAKGKALGAATVTDRLPDGWEFTTFTDGLDYLIFEGTGSADGTVLAKDTTPDTVDGLTADIHGQDAVFTFKTLDRPYVILVKARPTDETLADYFGTNKTTTARNNLSLKAENWIPGVDKFQDVTIDSKLLGKEYEIPEEGVLKWSVDYKPYALKQNSTRIEDIIPIGLDLRLDSNGQLLLSDDNITVYKLVLHPDGSHSIGDKLPLELNKSIFYDTQARALTFVMPDNTQAYRLRYLTDVTGEVGEVKNVVTLYGKDDTQESTGKSYIITEADGSASLKRNGWIHITKIDEADNPMEGVEFTLYAADGKTIMKSGITGSGGVLKFKVIPDGDYILRETAATPGYTPEEIDHILTVETIDGQTITSIDGKTGENANVIKIRNLPVGTVGNLTVRKIVEGEDADSAKSFAFTVTLYGAAGTYNYTKNGILAGEIKSGDSISLAHGESITIMGIPKDTAYSIIEADYSGEGYTSKSVDNTGWIIEDTTQETVFTNTYKPAAGGVDLQVQKVLEGKKLTAGEFDFELRDENGTVIQKKSNDENGAVKFDTIPYDIKGVYSYTIQEVIGTQKDITYDRHEVSVKVTVTDEDAQLVAIPVYEGEQIFTNTYKPADIKTNERNKSNKPKSPVKASALKAKPAKTGDPNRQRIYSVVFMSSLLGIVSIMYIRRRYYKS